jgi:flagellar basal-body rod protein FlgB
VNPIASDSVTNLLETFLDVQSKRSQVIAGNIANVDTPGFVAKELDFNDYLRAAVEKNNLQYSKQDQQGMKAETRVIDQTPTAIGLDGNTVDAGHEMADLAQTGSNFTFGAKMLQSRLRLLRMAIREGK